MAYYSDKILRDLITTVSGDLDEKIPSLSGYATESWTNLTFIDNAEMTTISGDLVSQMGGSVTLVGIGGITTEQDGSTWYIDGSTISGGTTASGGSLSCVDCDTQGRLCAPSGVVTPSVYFSDGTTATTVKQITGCSGTIVIETAWVNYSDSSIVDLFTLPANHEIVEVGVTVVSGFSPGYTASYPDLRVGDTLGNSAYTWLVNNSLQNSFWINQIGIYSANGSANIKLKLAKKLADSFYEIQNLTVSGGATTFTTSGGFYWQTIDPVAIPDTGTYYIGIYTGGGSLTNFVENDSTLGVGRIYWSGDKVGFVTGGITDTAYTPQVQVRYGTRFTVGDETSSVDGILQGFSPLGYTSTISGLLLGTSTGPTPYDRYIRSYRSQLLADTQGKIQITVGHRDHCYDPYVTTMQGQGNILVENTGLNSYMITDVPKCYQSSCQYTVQTLVSGMTSAQRQFLLPANHILTSVTTSGYIQGGSNGSVGTSLAAPNASCNLYTFVQSYFNLINGATISTVWLYASAAGTAKIKLAKKGATDAYYDLTDICTVSHPGGNQEVEFSIPATTITGVGSDVFRIAVYWTNGGNSRFNYGAIGGYYKSGDQTGLNRGVFTDDFSPVLVRVGYQPYFSIGTSDDNRNLIYILSTTSGTLSSSSALGPYSSVTPINLYIYQDTPPVGGYVNTTFRYYNPDYVTYTMGTATWSGLDGSCIIHNLGTSNHFTFVSPLNQNAESWWVTKGDNADYVYTLTLSGSGQFDWSIQS